MILAVAVIAVCAIAIIGVGYAYTATTQNSDNTSTVKYIELNQGTTGDAYVSGYTAGITYNTVNTAPNVTSYTINNEEELNGLTNVKAVKLGTVVVNVVKSTGNTDAFKFSVKNIDDPNDTTDKITLGDNGKLYVGFILNNEAATTEKVREYTINVDNYYDTTTTAGSAATDKNAAATINPTKITVNLYYAPNNDGAAPGTLEPLKNVDFVFTAEA